MSNTVFLDCFNREIKVGDVLASGQRRGSHGGVRVGIVTGFTEKSVLADMVDGNWNGWDRTKQRDTAWTLRKGHFSTPYNCVITGMTEADLRQITGLNVFTSRSTPIRDITPRLLCISEKQSWQ